MENSIEGKERNGQVVQQGNGNTTSERKRQANRENATKSTGPRTAVGKANSRGNAVKHGFFMSPLSGFADFGEDPKELIQFYEGLCDLYHPVGTAEGAELANIAVGWWRRRRLWRYENAVTLGALLAPREKAERELEELGSQSKAEDEAALQQLQKVRDEITRTETLTPEQKQIISSVEDMGEEEWSKVHQLQQYASLEPEERTWIVALDIAEGLIEHLKRRLKARVLSEVATGENLIPNVYDLNKILRYDAASDRSLSRSLDRLERLQRLRKEKPESPSASVNLAQQSGEQDLAKEEPSA